LAPYPVSTLPKRWWETYAALARPYLKFKGITLKDLTSSLDEYAARGIDALEIFAPCKGGVCYHGLDTIDYYQVDPAIGTMDDFKNLVAEAHARKIAVIAFHNLGYGHEQFPAFLKACDDIRQGIDSPEALMFVWSDTGKDGMDRSLAPHFMNDSHGNWRWSERARHYFWVKWEGEQGGFLLPQFNYADPGWQQELRRIIDFWLQTGIDGMVIDAVNWYVGCNWQINRFALTGLLNQADNQFSQPEGAGGFGDDPVPWITQGGYNCIMDYAIKKWWEGRDTIRDAILSGDPSSIEATLQNYRDRVVHAGGVCYIDPPNLDDQSTVARLLGIATVATMGELFILIGNQLDRGTDEYEQTLAHLLQARKQYPALCAGGTRQQVHTQDDKKFYAFIRQASTGGQRMLVTLNYQSTPQTIQVDLADHRIPKLTDIWTGIQHPCLGSLQLTLPGYGYAILKCDDPF
jgi:glycosidase